MTVALTARQRAVVDFVGGFVAVRGYGPSYKEVAEAVGLTSTSSVAHIVKTLRKQGWLGGENHRRRTLHVTTPPDTAPCPVCRGTGVDPRTEKETA